MVECQGPEPGGGHGFRFRGASEHHTTHTYNSTLDSHSPGNEAATPNFYFLNIDDLDMRLLTCLYTYFPPAAPSSARAKHDSTSTILFNIEIDNGRNY